MTCDITKPKRPEKFVYAVFVCVCEEASEMLKWMGGVFILYG